MTMELSKRAYKMTENGTVLALSRRGTQKHKTNPFLVETQKHTRKGVKKISNKQGDKLMLVSESTGEIVAPAGFWQTQEVDRTQFVKLYINGVKAFKDLSSAGTKVFAVLYDRVQHEIGKDVLYLSFYDINQEENPMSESTYMRGIKELINKDFIAESMTASRYFLNPDFMWNGDRLAFVKEYRVAKTSGKLNDFQMDLLANK